MLNIQNSPLKLASICLAVGLFLAQSAMAKETPAEHRAEVAKMHQQMAAAHSQAATCMTAAKNEKEETVCHEALKKACKGVGIGKTCGMKHAH